MPAPALLGYLLQLGKRGGSFPDQVKALAMKELLARVGISIIRPTLPAPVLMPDGELRTMASARRTTSVRGGEPRDPPAGSSFGQMSPKSITAPRTPSEAHGGQPGA